MHDAPVPVPVGKREVFCGSYLLGCSLLTNRRSADFNYPMSACRDPLNPTGYYLSDRHSVRYFDEARDEVSLIAGSSIIGERDGIGDAARFMHICQLLISCDGKTVWCAVSGPTPLRRIDIATRRVKSHLLGRCHIMGLSLGWDRSPAAKPDSAIYFSDCDGRLHRCDTTDTTDTTGTDILSEHLLEVSGISACQIVCTPTGHVIVSSNAPVLGAVYAYDPVTCGIERLDGIEVLRRIALIDSDRMLVGTSDSAVVRNTLPPHLFLLPKCCERFRLCCVVVHLSINTIKPDNRSRHLNPPHSWCCVD